MVLSAIHSNPYQKAKFLNPVQVPMCNVNHGKCWQQTFWKFQYCVIPTIIVMDYFTKWVGAVPLQNQTAASVTQAITKISSKYIWHSFYSTFQSRMQFQESHASANVKVFGMQKSHTTAYHAPTIQRNDGAI